MDLFAALDYAGPENRTSAVLLAVLHHLGPDAREALLAGVVPSGLGPVDELRAQHGVSVGVLDGWIRWSGRCALVLEAKVDDALGQEQPERYAAWLAQHAEPHLVLWLVTRESTDVDTLVPGLKRPAGVSVVTSTWTFLADRAAELAPMAGETDRLLLSALARRLRRSGAALTKPPMLKADSLRLALAGLPHTRALRRQILAWVQGLTWLRGEWTREAKHEDWCELSVYAERWLKLAKTGADGKAQWAAWRAQVYAPAGDPGRWPGDQAHGVALRLGVRIRGVVASDLALGSIRAALGATSNADAPRLSACRPVIWDSGSYHETWWIIPVDPMDLPSTAERLRAAMTDQAERLGPIFEGGVEALRPG